MIRGIGKGGILTVLTMGGRLLFRQFALVIVTSTGLLDALIYKKAFLEWPILSLAKTALEKTKPAPTKGNKSFFIKIVSLQVK
jgi:hypothetical protein